MKLLALMKKEFLRFFRDPRLIITMLLPGILIYAIYSLIGSFVNNEPKYDFKVLLSGESAAVDIVKAAVDEADNMTVTFENADDVEAAKEKVKNGDTTAFVVFSPDFDNAVSVYDPASGEAAPTVAIYYRSGDGDSAAFYNLFVGVMNGYEEMLANKFDVLSGEGYDFSDPTEFAVNMMSGMLPFIVVIMIFSSGMSVTLESVAGEKERGTLATILVTSVKRSHIALGKVIPLSCISSIGALSSFLGIALSMPKLMGTSLGVLGGYSFLSYFMIFFLVVGIVPLIVSLVSVVSAFSRSVKEASAYTGVLMIVSMVLSISVNFISGIGNWVVAIPLLNAVVAMNQVFTHSAPVWMPFTAFAVNLVYTALLVFAIAKMLSSERIMFGK